MSVRLGYACINITLGLTTSRTAVTRTLMALPPTRAVALLRELSLANIADLYRILEWNAANGVHFFRITSGLFPHMGDRALAAQIPSPYFRGDIDFARQALARVGQYAKKHDIRLTFHSNPYCQLGAQDPEVLRATLFDLAVYTRIIQALGVQDSCIIVHGGGVYGDKPGTLGRIEAQVRALPAAVRNQLAFENDERHYSPDDLLPMCERLDLPFCFDMFHNSISASRIPVTGAFLQRVCATWTRRGLTPKFHISDQDAGGRFGSHAEYVREIPPWMFRLPRVLGIPRVDLMVEAKGKELALLQLRRRHGANVG